MLDFILEMIHKVVWHEVVAIEGESIALSIIPVEPFEAVVPVQSAHYRGIEWRFPGKLVFQWSIIR